MTSPNTLIIDQVRMKDKILAVKQTVNQDLFEYQKAFEDCATNIKASGSDLQDAELVVRFIENLDQSRYSEFCNNKYNNVRQGRDTYPKTIAEAAQQAYDYKSTLNINHSNTKKNDKADNATVNAVIKVLRNEINNSGNNNHKNNKNNKQQSNKGANKKNNFNKRKNNNNNNKGNKNKKSRIVSRDSDDEDCNSNATTVAHDKPRNNNDHSGKPSGICNKCRYVKGVTDRYHWAQECPNVPNVKSPKANLLVEKLIFMTVDSNTSKRNNNEWQIVMDPGSSYNVFKNKQLLKNIVRCEPVTVDTAGGVPMILKFRGETEHFGYAYYHPNAVTNLISLGEIGEYVYREFSHKGDKSHLYSFQN